MIRLYKALIIIIHVVLTIIIALIIYTPAWIAGTIYATLLKAESYLARQRHQRGNLWKGLFKTLEVALSLLELPFYLITWLLNPIINFPKFLLTLIP